MKAVTKIIDTKTIPNSKLDRYWQRNGFTQIYKAFRKGLTVPPELKNVNNALKVQTAFNYGGFQFGNWVTNEDRYNYLSALYIASYDLNKILKLNKNIGFDKVLSVSFGSRGSGTAIAHFEPGMNVINITRYRDGDTFITSGGIGAFAHEYGHFLDYYLGRHYDRSNQLGALSGGSIVNSKQIDSQVNSGIMRAAAEEIIQIANWKDPYKVESDFIKRIKSFSEMPYYRLRDEIFARLFEQYISYKLQKINVYNRFLCETKYTPKIYMNSRELAKVIPLYDRIIEQLRKIQ